MTFKWAANKTLFKDTAALRARLCNPSSVSAGILIRCLLILEAAALLYEAGNLDTLVG